MIFHLGEGDIQLSTQVLHVGNNNVTNEDSIVTISSKLETTLRLITELINTIYPNVKS